MSTTTRSLEGSHKELRAGNIGRRLDGDDFRVGSYVVHTPPTTPNNSGHGSARAAIASRSHIPNYQFKSKIATINQQQHQSPPLSPKKGTSGLEHCLASGYRNGNEYLSSAVTSGGQDARRHQQNNQQSSGASCSSINYQNYSINNSSPAKQASPQSVCQPPKAIPRSMVCLKQKSSLISNRTSHLQEYEPNKMGDRLSSPAIQHQLAYNSSQPNVAMKHHYNPHQTMDFDQSAYAKLSPSLSRYQISHRGQDDVDVMQRENTNVGGGGGGGGGGGNNNGSSSGSVDEVFKLTPRLPRGVSKIPHQVHAHENVNANHYQSHESTIKNCFSNSNRYLTFSKDQATSHFKSLKEELEGQKRDPDRKDNDNRATTTITSPSKPKPLERLNRANDNNNIEHAKFSTSTTLRQQPICEAFIMTGQSMLKLSCNESENSYINHNNKNTITDSQKQKEAKLKSLSLNKLSGSLKVESHLSSENIDLRQSSKGEATKIGTYNLQEVSRERPTKNDNISKITTTTTATNSLTQMQTETITTPLTSMLVTPSSDNSSPIVLTKNTSTSNVSVCPTRQTATNITPQTITETNSREPEVVDSRHIELCDGFWNNPINITKSTRPIASQTSKSIGPPDVNNDNLLDNEKGQLSISARFEKDKFESNSIVSTQTSLANGVNLNHRSKNEESPPTKMKNFEELKRNLETDKTFETEPAISEATPLALSTNLSCNDRDSAKRLAKRLYNLSGFKRSDVCHHLAKSNPFSQMVAEEYVNLFDFRSMKLDAALRKFLSKLQLNGETQERERMLSQFSQRYYDCNKDKFPNSDIVQTLVCAMILLNTDLHGGHNKKKRSKLSLGAFIDGLNNSIAGGPDCGDGSICDIVGGSSTINGNHTTTIAYTFPRHQLIDLYESIKKRPLKCSDDKCDMTSLEAELDKIYSQQVGSNRSNTLPTRRFAPGSNAPSSTLNASSRRHFKQGLNKLNSGSVGGCQDDSDAAIQFKCGYLNRKRIFEAHGKPTSKGRRSWRRVYVTLQDLRMIMQLGIHDDSKDGDTDQLAVKKASRAQTITQKMKNTIKIHHTFAKRSTKYTKRDNVFHLRLADQSEFLLQANNEQEMGSWIDTINFATACLSSPALPSAISSSKQHQPQNQKPLLPAAYTKLSYWEQLIDHEERLQRLKVELDEHLSEAPNTKNANKRFKTEFIEKIAFLKHEIERYSVYVDLMRKKSNSPEAIVLSKHPHIASLTPSDQMILSLPSFAPPRSTTPSQQEQQQQPQ